MVGPYFPKVVMDGILRPKTGLEGKWIGQFSETVRPNFLLSSSCHYIGSEQVNCA